MTIMDIENEAASVGVSMLELMKKRSQPWEALHSDRKLIAEAPPDEDIFPLIESREWNRSLGEATSEQLRRFRNLIEMIRKLPHDDRVTAIARACSILQEVKKT